MNLLLAAMLLMQDKTAEEALKKIEENILKAKTLSVSFSLPPEKKDGPLQSGTIWIKGESKWRLELDMVDGDKETHRLLQIVDGSRFQNFADGTSRDKPKPVPAGFSNRDQTAALVRIGWGATFGLLFLLGDSADHPKEVHFERQLIVSDLTSEQAQGEVSIVSYTVSLVLEKNAPAKWTTRMRLYYDLKSLTPLKREFTMNSGDEKLSTEIYKGWSIDKDIPDEKFKLAEEKK
jgi:outer membrane lipoprotein-sorting protein